MGVSANDRVLEFDGSDRERPHESRWVPRPCRPESSQERSGGDAVTASDKSVKWRRLSARSERNDIAHLYIVNAHITALAAHA